MKTCFIDEANVARKFFHGYGEAHGGVLSGFLSTLSAASRQFGCSHFAVCADPLRETLDRVKEDPTYKANRSERPEDLTDEVEFCREFLRSANIPIIEDPGLEADDVLFTAALTFHADRANEVVIVSADKDLLALTSLKRLKVVQPAKGQLIPTTADDVLKKFGVHPKNMFTYLALVGDSSDGFPGVKGVGPKKAVAAIADAFKIGPDVAKVLSEGKVKGVCGEEFRRSHCLAVPAFSKADLTPRRVNHQSGYKTVAELADDCLQHMKAKILANASDFHRSCGKV